MEYVFLADINTLSFISTGPGDSAITFPSTSVLPESCLSIFAFTPSCNLHLTIDGSYRKADTPYIPHPPMAQYFTLPHLVLSDSTLSPIVRAESEDSPRTV
jgi:hypothetical protein